MHTAIATSIDMRRLGLGTVQFGLDYGVSNSEGRTSSAEAARIISEAARMGIKTLDTAAGYGDSEKVLGEILPDGHGFNIVTKTIQFNRAQISLTDANTLEAAFAESLARLRANSLYGLMVHSADDLLRDGGGFIWRKLCEFKRNGQVEKIGASVYTAKQIDALLDRYDFDIIQVPLNIFDQRLIHSRYLERLKLRGVEIHARSVFLQGLLLMAPSDVPARLAGIKDDLNYLHHELLAHELTPLEGALDFVLSIPEVDRAVIGVCSVEQFHEVCAVIGGRAQRPAPDWSRFALKDEKILNPADWPKE